MKQRCVVALALLLALLVGALAPPQAQAQAVVLKNPSFDMCSAGTATYPDDWSPGAPPAGCSTTARTGTYSLQLKQYGAVRQDVSITSAGTVTFSVWVKVAFNPYDYRVTVGGASCLLYAPVSGAVWQQAQCSAVVAAPGVVTLGISAPSYVGTPGLLFDDAQVVLVAPTATPTATSTPTGTPTATSTGTPTPTSTPTATPAASSTPTVTATGVPSPTPFPVPVPRVYLPAVSAD
jgi:hypothetical protein